mgnify:CR=1 FL=1
MTICYRLLQPPRFAVPTHCLCKAFGQEAGRFPSGKYIVARWTGDPVGMAQLAGLPRREDRAGAEDSMRRSIDGRCSMDGEGRQRDRPELFSGRGGHCGADFRPAIALGGAIIDFQRLAVGAIRD